MSRASALGVVLDSGGRKNCSPVDPPMFTPRSPGSSIVLPRISMSWLPPLHWIALPELLVM